MSAILDCTRNPTIAPPPIYQIDQIDQIYQIDQIDQNQ